MRFVNRLSIQVQVLGASYILAALLCCMAGHTVPAMNDFFVPALIHLLSPIGVTEELACQSNHVAFPVDERACGKYGVVKFSDRDHGYIYHSSDSCRIVEERPRRCLLKRYGADRDPYRTCDSLVDRKSIRRNVYGISTCLGNDARDLLALLQTQSRIKLLARINANPNRKLRAELCFDILDRFPCELGSVDYAPAIFVCPFVCEG